MMSKRETLMVDCARVRNQKGGELYVHPGCVRPDDERLDDLPGGVAVSWERGRPLPTCGHCDGELRVVKRIPE